MSDRLEIEGQQREVCRRFGVDFLAAPAHLKVGLSRNVREGVQPVNGVRHPPTGDTTGWYIWAGEEPDSAEDFFEPQHVAHLVDWCPEVLPYLGLPPGFRFQVALNHEDVWEDPSLLKVDPDPSGEPS